LDSKSPQDIAILENSPVLSDYLSDASKERFAFITKTLEHMDIPFTINPRLVRGLDYYQDTVFEFKVTSPLLGAQQGTVLAGGRYDGLVEKMGGPVGVSSIGWAAGLERLSLLVEEDKIPSSARPIAIIPVPDRGGSNFSVELDEKNSNSNSRPSVMALHSHAMSVGAALRAEGLRVEFMHLTGSSSSKSQLPKQLARASKMNASHAILIGTDEMQMGVVTLKDLDKTEQQRCPVDDLVRALSAQ
jgi:histidyl-tRNA synthetase